MWIRLISGAGCLVPAHSTGNPRILNSPIDNRIPGRERAVGNHLGVMVERVD
jgi:hypothetical protein